MINKHHQPTSSCLPVKSGMCFHVSTILWIQLPPPFPNFPLPWQLMELLTFLKLLHYVHRNQHESSQRTEDDSITGCLDFFQIPRVEKKTWALKRREISWLWMWTGKLWRRWYEWTTCEVWYKNWISTTKRTKCNCTSRAEILTIDWFYRRKIGVSFHSSLQMIGVFLSDFLDPKCLAPKFKSSGNVTERPKSPPPMRHKLTQTCQHAFVQNDHTTTAWKVMVGSWPLGPITLRIFEVSFLCFQFLRKLLAVCRQNIFPIQDMLLLKMLLLRIY